MPKKNTAAKTKTIRGVRGRRWKHVRQAHFRVMFVVDVETPEDQDPNSIDVAFAVQNAMINLMEGALPLEITEGRGKAKTAAEMVSADDFGAEFIEEIE